MGPIDGVYDADGISRFNKSIGRKRLPLESLMKKTKGKKSQKFRNFSKKIDSNFRWVEGLLVL